MSGVVVEIDGSRISDSDTFHDVFAEAFGFPDWYGRNMDAWIDLLSSIDGEQGASAVITTKNEMITLHVSNYKGLKARCPDVVEAMLECAAFVNSRRLDQPDRSPILAIAFTD